MDQRSDPQVGMVVLMERWSDAERLGLSASSTDDRELVREPQRTSRVPPGSECWWPSEGKAFDDIGEQPGGRYYPPPAAPSRVLGPLLRAVLPPGVRAAVLDGSPMPPHVGGTPVSVVGSLAGSDRIGSYAACP